MNVYVDADACPVKEEVYRVAERHAIGVTLVANAVLRDPERDFVRMVVVAEGLDAADDWIAAHAGPGDIVITGDIPLAARVLENGAKALGFHGRAFTPENIGDAMATRELMAGLREIGERGGGPAPFQKQDRSRFLQALDNMIHSIRRDS